MKFKWMKNETNFQHFNEAHPYNTRGSSNIQLSSVDSGSHGREACLMAAKVFNKLPMGLKREVNLMVFSRGVKTHLVNGAFYTVDEFFHA